MSGVLLAHCGAQRIPKEALYEIETPVGTETWKPIPHGHLVDSLHLVLSDKGLTVQREEYAVQRNGHLLFGVMDFAWQTDDHIASMGIRTSNDKTFSIQIAVGARVVICDNLLLSGELIALKRKHTSRLNLDNELYWATDRYIDGYGKLEFRIDQLKQRQLTVLESREKVFTIFSKRIVPLRLFPKVAYALNTTVTERQPISLWSLHNLFTEQLKALSPGVAFESNVKLGKFFGLKSF